MIPHVLLTMDMPDFTNPSVIFGLLTLTFLEIVLGIDNIIFISIISNKLALQDQPTARRLGLILAMLMRIVLLFGISWLISLQKPFFSFDVFGMHAGVTGQALILFLGGLFLLYKATTEIHHKLEGNPDDDNITINKGPSKLNAVILQIAVVNIVFSFDSILTAVGLTDNIILMIVAVVLSILIMMSFSGPVATFVNRHPSIQLLGMAFLIMIGFMLIAEAAHLSHIIDAEVPKGYMYFSIAFSLFVEMLNIRYKKKQKPVAVRGIIHEAQEEGVIDK